MRLAIALFACLAFAACTPDGPKVKPGSDPAVIHDWDDVCNAWTRAGAIKEQDPEKRMALISQWVSSHVKTPQVAKALGPLSVMPMADRRAALQAAAKEDGYLDPCGLSWLPAPK